MNPGPLEEQSVLLNAESSLWALLPSLISSEGIMYVKMDRPKEDTGRAERKEKVSVCRLCKALKALTCSMQWCACRGVGSEFQDSQENTKTKVNKKTLICTVQTMVSDQ